MGSLLDEMMQQRMQRFARNQIPQAEREADALARQAQGARTPDEVKMRMGAVLGADFSDVRFHTGTKAEQAAGEMGARAYTTSRDVYFGEGGFDPAIAAHELVHTVQQGVVDSAVPTVGAPAGGVQMVPDHKINLRKMRFGKRAYRNDADYQGLKQLIEQYNASDDDPGAKAALMEAAMQYIDRFSTGEQAMHKGRTSLAEDLLYQLSTNDGQQEQALGNLQSLSANMTVEGYGQQDMMEGALQEMRRMVKGRGKYSKAMQMTSAGVLSQLGPGTTLAASGKSGTKRNLGSNDYAIEGRATINKNDTIGTTLHEMTHAASGKIYDNTTNFFTIGRGAGDEEIRARRDDRARRMGEISQAAQGGAKGRIRGDARAIQGLENWVADDRQSYALGGKMIGQYIPGEKKKMMRAVKQAAGQDMSGADNAALTALLPEYEGTMTNLDAQPGLSPAMKQDLRKNYAGMQRMESAFGQERNNTDALIEYDPVINQIFAQYEHGSDDRSSEFYRKTKAAVLRSHVDRQKELLAQRASRPAPQPAPPQPAARKRWWQFWK